MKHLTIAMALLFCLVLPASADIGQFCAGYQKGYVAAYMRAAQTMAAPTMPPCPYQPAKGYGDPQSDFEQGYLLGVEDGTMAAHR
tara:strand:- start:9035 stop:9289 length:255 start_codon:yes stop_codon:yes gene_type:complete